MKYRGTKQRLTRLIRVSISTILVGGIQQLIDDVLAEFYCDKVEMRKVNSNIVGHVFNNNLQFSFPGA